MKLGFMGSMLKPKVVNVETGEAVENLIGVTYEASVDGEMTLTVRVRIVPPRKPDDPTIHDVSIA